MFFRDRQVVDLQGAHVCLDGFLDVGQRGILRFALGDAAGQAGALGDPEAIFPSIDENLSHTFIMPDSEGHGECATSKWGHIVRSRAILQEPNEEKCRHGGPEARSTAALARQLS